MTVDSPPAPPTVQVRTSVEPNRRTSTVLALLQTARPHQWSKNVLVLAVPAAAAELLTVGVVTRLAWAVVVMVLASASTYLTNDAHDVAVDRAHPRKALRPVASGVLSTRLAARCGFALAVLALVAAVPLGWGLVAVVATYLTLTYAYCVRLKHVPVVDIVVVAAGFVLRSLAGAAATHTSVSSWFLLVALFGSLYLVAAKRLAEAERTAQGGVARQVLGSYPVAWLQQLVTISLAATLLSYAAWAVQYVGTDVALPALALSVVPFLVVLLRYSLLVSSGQGETPERLLASDRLLLGAAAVWAATVGGGLYLA